jgi:dienelactone hydrolase
LKQLLMDAANASHSRSDIGIVREEGNDASQISGSKLKSADPGQRHAFSRHNGAHYNAAAATLANGRTSEFLKQQLL